MDLRTLFFIILSGIIALLLALFQYKIGAKKYIKWRGLFILLRFLSLFGVFLVLLNPKFERIKVFTEKPNLVVAVDNSESVAHLKQAQNTLKFVEAIQSNAALNAAFDVDVFQFGTDIKTIDTLSFNAKQTNTGYAIQELSQIYKHTVAPLILVSDGNQTIGNDFEYASKNYKHPIYSIILGDSIRYSDLKIEQLNVNKYAYLKNKFPVEIIVSYTGDVPVKTNLVINSSTGKSVYSKPIRFSKTERSKLINFTLPTSQVGVVSFKAILNPLAKEKNKINNVKRFAVEVINEKTTIGIVSQISHPDLGLLKKSIESNDQRIARILNPKEALKQLNSFQLLILYQPDENFASLLEVMDRQNTNRLICAGPNTNWRFLNRVGKHFVHDVNKQTEDYQPALNANYTAFIVDDLDFESLPPLQSSFGSVTFSVPFESLLFKKTSGILTQDPLLATFETTSSRTALLLGEGLWKWRAQCFLNTGNYINFDVFFGKLIQYLSSNKRKNRLDVEYDSFYQGNTSVLIKAQFFNKNYEFDAKETLNISVTDLKTNTTKQWPLILKQSSYEVDLSHLPASNYQFTVKATRENISKSGQFTILDYNIEQQFLNANVTKLTHVATNSNGEAYFIDAYASLFNNLITDKRYSSIQKSRKTNVALVDWKYLLFLIVLCLSLEWFLRKYIGLI